MASSTLASSNESTMCPSRTIRSSSIAAKVRCTYAARVQRTLVGVGVAITVVTALVVGATSPRVSWFGRTITHGARDVPMVALTFDDGPNRASTLAVRDVLDQYGVKGTFFLVGS